MDSFFPTDALGSKKENLHKGSLSSSRTIGFNPPLSLPLGLAGFCTNNNEPAFSGAKAVKPPTQGRGRLNQRFVMTPGEYYTFP
jgi:hypothetical protein